MPIKDKNSTSFLQGFNSVLELSPHIDLPCQFVIKQKTNWLLADADALSNDWNKIGIDFDNAIRKYDDSDKQAED